MRATLFAIVICCCAFSVYSQSIPLSSKLNAIVQSERLNRLHFSGKLAGMNSSGILTSLHFQGRIPLLFQAYNNSTLSSRLNSASIQELLYLDFNSADLSDPDHAAFLNDTSLLFFHNLNVNDELYELYGVSNTSDYVQGMLEKSYNLYYYWILDGSPLTSAPLPSQIELPIHSELIPLYENIFQDTALVNFYNEFALALDASIETRNGTPLLINKRKHLYYLHRSGVFDRIYDMINSEEYLALIAHLRDVTQNSAPYIIERDDVTSRVLYCTDQGLNWQYSINFDEFGDIYSENINYVNLLGNSIQSQWMNYVSDQALASEQVPNEYFDWVVSAPSAPTNRTYLCYKENFIRSSQGNKYSYLDFNQYSIPVTTVGHKDNPSSISQTNPGELGWYYSNNNVSLSNSSISEPLNPASQFPVMFKDKYQDGTKRDRRANAPGDLFKPGSGREIRKYYATATQELDFLFGTNSSPFLTMNSLGAIREEVFEFRKYRKEIVENTLTQTATVNYYNPDDELVAKCMSGLGSLNVCTRKSYRVTNHIDIDLSNSIEIHMPLVNSLVEIDTLRLYVPQLRGALSAWYSSNTEEGLGQFEIADVYNSKKLVRGVNDDYRLVAHPASGRVEYYSVIFRNPVSPFLKITYKFSEGFLTFSRATNPDLFDRRIAVSHKLDYTHWSLYYYDENRKVTKIIPPKGIDCNFSPNYSLNTITLSQSNVNSGNSISLTNSSINLNSNPPSHSGFYGKFRVKLKGPVYNPPPPPPCGSCLTAYPIVDDLADVFGRPTPSGAIAFTHLVNSVYAFDRRIDTAIYGFRGRMYHRDSLLEGMGGTGVFSQDTNLYLVSINNTLISEIDKKITQFKETVPVELDSMGIWQRPFYFNLHDSSFAIDRKLYLDTVLLSPGQLFNNNANRQSGSGISGDIAQYVGYPAQITQPIRLKFTNANNPTQVHEVSRLLRINLTAIYFISGARRTYFMTSWQYFLHDEFSPQTAMLDFSAGAAEFSSTKLSFLPTHLSVLIDGPAVFYSNSDTVNNTMVHPGGTIPSMPLPAYLLQQLQLLSLDGFGTWIPASKPNQQMATNLSYNQQGSMVYGQNNDVGAREAVYNSIGLLRFSQDAELRLANRFAYVHYDQASRPIESGLYVGENANVLFDEYKNRNNLFVPGNLTAWTNKNNELDQLNYFSPGVTAEDVHVLYDVAATDLPTTGGSYVQRFLHGKVSKTWNDHSTTWYSYNYQGSLEWVLQQITGLGVTTIDYTYDMLGNVLTVDYMKHRPSERLVHHYTYDANKALLLAETSRNGISKRPEAKYIYYLHGPLKRVELAHNLQGIDYTYTLDGKLKAINHADLDPLKDPSQDGLRGVSGFMQDQFGLILDYHHQDYAKHGTDFQTGQNMGTAERYDGLIKSSRWKIRNGSQSATLQQAYKYTYDKLGQLTLAEFGTYSPATQSLTVGNTNKENPSSYDIHGNILALQRTNASGAMMDNFTYQYPAFSNRLTSVTNTGGNSGYSAAMTYFTNGNIKTLQEGSSSPVRHLAYNAMGLTAKVAKGSTGNEPIVTFVYNERGQRIKKETYNPTGSAIAFTTYYVYDLGGNLLSTYEKYHNNTDPPQQKELYLYGADMLGVMHGQGAAAGGGELPCEECPIPPAPERIGIGGTTNTVYYLKDHLGNVRATLLREQPVHAGLLNWASYYPFGMRLTDNATMSSGHAALISSYPQRHWYQGDYSELDPETGLQAFDLRMYSSRIGRWLSVDPYAQYWSPYLAMGNNPVSRVDPDGGADGDPETGKAVGVGVYDAVLKAYVIPDAAVVNGSRITSKPGLNSGSAAAMAARRSMNMGQIENGVKTMIISSVGFSTGLGLLSSPTGLGQISGAFVMSFSVTSFGLGMAMVADGMGGGNQRIPSDPFEATDQGMGGDGKYGQFVGILATGVPKTSLEAFITAYQISESKLMNQPKPILSKPAGYNVLIQQDNTTVIRPVILLK